MSKQGNTAAAHLKARRALKGFKKLRKYDEVKDYLDLLISLCKENGSENDADAYSIMLESLHHSHEAVTQSTSSPGDSLQRGDSTETLYQARTSKVVEDPSLTATELAISDDIGIDHERAQEQSEPVNILDLSMVEATVANVNSIAVQGNDVDDSSSSSLMRSQSTPTGRSSPVGRPKIQGLPLSSYSHTASLEAPSMGCDSNDDIERTEFGSAVIVDRQRISHSLVPSPLPSKTTSEQNQTASGRAEIKRKLVIVGDWLCGKSYLLTHFSKGFCPNYYIPTPGFYHFVTDIKVDGKHVELTLWDTAGQEDYDRLRSQSYPDAHVILICLSITNPDSLDSVQKKWISEVLHFCQGLPILLVGLKQDRGDPHELRQLAKTSQHAITREEGEEVRKKIGAYKYLECSAKTGPGVREVFEHATRAAMLTRRRKKRWSLFRSSKGT